MDHVIKVTREGTPPEISRPAPERVLEGDPIHTTWSLEDRAPLYAGLWHTTPGTWRVDYQEWEYIRILEGLSILTDEAGTQTRLAPGDSFLIRPGFKGTWTCVEPTLKDYVILE